MYTVILIGNDNVKREMTMITIESAENLVKIAAKSGHYKEAKIVHAKTQLD